MNAGTRADRILRVTAVGAGAIGGLIAAFIARVGHEVSVLIRNALNAQHILRPTVLNDNLASACT